MKETKGGEIREGCRWQCDVAMDLTARAADVCSSKCGSEWSMCDYDCQGSECSAGCLPGHSSLSPRAVAAAAVEAEILHGDDHSDGKEEDDSLLARLMEMGFPDVAANSSLLQQFDNDLTKVIDHLTSATLPQLETVGTMPPEPQEWASGIYDRQPTMEPSTKLTIPSFASVLARVPLKPQAAASLATEGGLTWKPETASNIVSADVKGARGEKEREAEEEGCDDAVVPRGLKGRRFRRRFQRS